MRIFVVSITVRNTTKQMALNSLDWRAINIAQKDGYLCRAEVMDYLGVSSSTLYKYQTEKGLPYYKVGNRPFYKREDIDNWMMSKK